MRLKNLIGGFLNRTDWLEEIYLSAKECILTGFDESESKKLIEAVSLYERFMDDKEIAEHREITNE